MVSALGIRPDRPITSAVAAEKASTAHCSLNYESKHKWLTVAGMNRRRLKLVRDWACSLFAFGGSGAGRGKLPLAGTIFHPHPPRSASPSLAGASKFIAPAKSGSLRHADHTTGMEWVGLRNAADVASLVSK
jgi:hypothetical protein